MLLWDYQDMGYSRYRLITNGDTCEDCISLNGKIFSVDKAESGKNFPPIHPNCDCTFEIVDEQGNAVITADERAVREKDDKLGYLSTSLRQIVLGNYTDDVTLLGTIGQMILGLTGVDLPADIRDLFYDVTNWKNTPEHILQTALDSLALVPVIGGIKYIDEAADLIQIAAKHSDEAADAVKAVAKQSDELPKVESDFIGGLQVSKFDIDKIRSRLKTEPSTAFFWSGKTDGIGGADIAVMIAKEKGGVTLESTIDANNITIPEWDLNNPSSMDAWEKASAVFAEQVRGEVRAVIGKELRSENIWENIELPILIKNQNVTKITIIDPKTQKETIIFER